MVSELARPLTSPPGPTDAVEGLAGVAPGGAVGAAGAAEAQPAADAEAGRRSTEAEGLRAAGHPAQTGEQVSVGGLLTLTLVFNYAPRVCQFWRH